MAIVEKKIWPEYFEAIQNGSKKWELRLGDFTICEGDMMLLREWDPKSKEYTGRQMEKKVTRVTKFKIDELFWPKEEVEKHGIQIISLE